MHGRCRHIRRSRTLLAVHGHSCSWRRPACYSKECSRHQRQTLLECWPSVRMARLTSCPHLGATGARLFGPSPHSTPKPAPLPARRRATAAAQEPDAARYGRRGGPCASGVQPPPPPLELTHGGRATPSTTGASGRAQTVRRDHRVAATAPCGPSPWRRPGEEGASSRTCDVHHVWKRVGCHGRHGLGEWRGCNGWPLMGRQWVVHDGACMEVAECAVGRGGWERGGAGAGARKTDLATPVHRPTAGRPRDHRCLPTDVQRRGSIATSELTRRAAGRGWLPSQPQWACCRPRSRVGRAAQTRADTARPPPTAAVVPVCCRRRWVDLGYGRTCATPAAAAACARRGSGGQWPPLPLPPPPSQGVKSARPPGLGRHRAAR